jgi:NADPH2:quinone reductase
MRAVRCHTLTGPAGLRVDDLPEPAPGPGEVLLDVRAAGLNFPDVLLSHGKYQFKPPTPFIPGGEAAGLVLAVGDGVTDLAPGDRVATTMIHGAFAERLVVPAAVTIKLPDAVPFAVAAACMVTYGTTIHALADRADIKEGETLLVLGAAGGVGVAAIELGKLLGARVIAAARGADKLAFCRDHGADEVIDYTTEDLKERVKQLTRGDGADVVYDPVGGAYAEPALRSIAWAGRYLVVGFASGEIPKIPLNLVLLKGCAIVGVFWGSFIVRDLTRHRANVARILHAIADGRLRPHVDATLPFERAGEALARLERREVLGKLVLVP